MAMTPPRTNATDAIEPALRMASPGRTKIPAPIIVPTPIVSAASGPRSFASSSSLIAVLVGERDYGDVRLRHELQRQVAREETHEATLPAGVEGDGACAHLVGGVEYLPCDLSPVGGVVVGVGKHGPH